MQSNLLQSFARFASGSAAAFTSSPPATDSQPPSSTLTSSPKYVQHSLRATIVLPRALTPPQLHDASSRVGPGRHTLRTSHHLPFDAAPATTLRAEAEDRSRPVSDSRPAALHLPRGLLHRTHVGNPSGEHRGRAEEARWHSGVRDGSARCGYSSSSCSS